MKAILEFNLDDYEERKAHKRAILADNAYSVITSMFAELRKVWKYSEDDESVKKAEYWKDKLAELCQEESINIDDY